MLWKDKLRYYGCCEESYKIKTCWIRKSKTNQKSDELIFILGQDSVLGIDLWKKVSELVKLCKFAVVPRDGVNDVNAAFLDKKVAGLGEKAVFLEGMPRINISSTNIRERIAARQSIEAMVPQKVFEIIEERNLYGS